MWGHVSNWMQGLFRQLKQRKMPDLKFTSVYVGKDWYYGINEDSKNQTYEFYKFKLDGEKHSVDAGEGIFLYLEF